MRNPLNKILMSKDKGVTKTSGANGVLSRLWRQMLLDLNIGPQKQGIFMQAYILDPKNKIPNTKKDQTSHRGNLTKEFSRPQMTWKVFMKAMRWLQLFRIDFIVRAYHADGKITEHVAPVNFGHRLEPDFMEKLEQPEEQEEIQFVPILDDDPDDVES